MSEQPQPSRAEVAISQVKNILMASRGQLKAALPTHLQDKGDAWISSAFSAVQRDPKLVVAVLSSPHTFTNALSEAAQYGLTPGTPEYYLTPRRNKGNDEILGIVGYQGEIELIYRAGAVSSVIAEVVYENDEYRYERGVDLKPVHRIPGGNFGPRKERGKLIGVYAYGIMKDGSISRIIEHGADHIEDVKRTSQGSDGQYSPWTKWPDQMWLKTAVHSLSKWVPTSAEYAREQHRAVAEGNRTTITAGDTPDTPRKAPDAVRDNPNPVPEYEDLGEHGQVNTGTGEFRQENPNQNNVDAAWGLQEPATTEGN
jgi:recombination protein RecT